MYLKLNDDEITKLWQEVKKAAESVVKAASNALAKSHTDDDVLRFYHAQEELDFLRRKLQGHIIAEAICADCGTNDCEGGLDTAR